MVDDKEKVKWLTPELYEKGGAFWYITGRGTHVRIGESVSDVTSSLKDITNKSRGCNHA